MPLGAFILFLFLTFWLAFVAVLAVLALLALFTLSFLAFLGVVSASACLGFWKKRPGLAIKAFILQSLGLIGAVDGALAVWFIGLARDLPIQATDVLAGASVGLLLGLLLGSVVIRVGRKVKGLVRVNQL